MKPLNRKAYGSIPHLLGSKLGKTDKYIEYGQHKILTEKTRDKHDIIIVEEKYDGSNVAVCKVKNTLIPINKAGYRVEDSPWTHHRDFGNWVNKNINRFKFLREGERVVGEWLGTVHTLEYRYEEPIVWFDMFDAENQRKIREEFWNKVGDLVVPTLYHMGNSTPIPASKPIKQNSTICKSQPEGFVYRCERKGKVDFLAKWVRRDFEPRKMKT